MYPTFVVLLFAGGGGSITHRSHCHGFSVLLFLFVTESLFLGCVRHEILVEKKQTSAFSTGVDGCHWFGGSANGGGRRCSVFYRRVVQLLCAVCNGLFNRFEFHVLHDLRVKLYRYTVNVESAFIVVEVFVWTGQEGGHIEVQF